MLRSRPKPSWVQSWRTLFLSWKWSQSGSGSAGCLPSGRNNRWGLSGHNRINHGNFSSFFGESVSAPEGTAVRGLQGPQPLKASGHPPESAMFCPLPLQSYQAQFQAVARHLDVKMDIAMLQKADLDAMIISMRTAHLSPNSINSYTRTLKSFFSWCNEQEALPASISRSTRRRKLWKKPIRI